MTGFVPPAVATSVGDGRYCELIQFVVAMLALLGTVATSIGNGRYCEDGAGVDVCSA